MSLSLFCFPFTWLTLNFCCYHTVFCVFFFGGFKIYCASESPWRACSDTACCHLSRVSCLFDLAWGPRIWISNKLPGDVDIASPGATLGDPLLQAWIPWNQETKEDLFAFISLYLKYLWLVSQMDKKNYSDLTEKGKIKLRILLGGALKSVTIVPFLSRGLASR